jgi:hypothetical protein
VGVAIFCGSAHLARAIPVSEFILTILFILSKMIFRQPEEIWTGFTGWTG